jgi:Raf kinase inhibitor-like YbhB/YbcL family protein
MPDFSINSSAFSNGERIPRRYTCQGEDRSPALQWSGSPAETRSLALILEDPDAPGGTFIHWVLYNLPPALDHLDEGTGASPTTGINSARRSGYMGPCPPPGRPHRYYWRLFALDLPADLEPGLSAAELRRRMQGHVLAEAQWMGTYQR